MAENSIVRTLELDLSASFATVRQLRDEIDALNASLRKLEKGTSEYTTTQQKAEQLQQQYNKALEITDDKVADEIKSVEELAGELTNITVKREELIRQMVAEQSQLDSLKAARKALADEEKQGRISSEEANEARVKLADSETKLNAQLSRTKIGLNAATKQIIAQKGSYDDLNQTLGRMRDAYRQLSEEQRNSAAGNEMLVNIQALDAKLKEIDATMGNHQRNVGNYTEAIKAALPPQAAMIVDFGKWAQEAGSIPQLLKGMATGLWGMVKAAAAFIATPLGAILTAIAVAGALVYKNWSKILEGFGYTDPVDRANKAIEQLEITIEQLNIDLEVSNTKALNIFTAALREAGGDAKKVAEATEAYNKALRDNALANAQAAQAAAWKAEEEAYAAYVDKQNEETTKALKEAQEQVAEANRKVAEANNAIAKAAADAKVAEVEAAEESRKAWAKTAEERKKADEQAAAERLAARGREMQEAFDAEQETLRLEKESDQLSADYAKQSRDQRLADIDKIAEEQSRTAWREIEDEEVLAEKRHEIEQNRLKSRLNTINQILLTEDLSSEERETLEQEATDTANQLSDNELAHKRKNKKKEQEIEKLTQETKLNIVQSTLSNMTTILGEESAAGKAMAVANATIDTYKAANSAYASMAGIPVVGPALGAAAAAAAVVSGIANVKKILSTNEDGSNAASVANGSPAAPAVVRAPAVVQQVPVTRSLTSASEEERLNQMAKDQRVYLVYSDVEEAGKQVEVQQSESTF